MDQEHVRAKLRVVTAEAGGVVAWAEANGMTPAYVWMVLKDQPPGKKILKALGLRKTDRYEVA